MDIASTSGSIYTNLCKQMGILGGLEKFVKHAQELKLCLIISNCDRIIKEDQN